MHGMIHKVGNWLGTRQRPCLLSLYPQRCGQTPVGWVLLWWKGETNLYYPSMFCSIVFLNPWQKNKFHNDPVSPVIEERKNQLILVQSSDLPCVKWNVITLRSTIVHTSNISSLEMTFEKLLNFHLNKRGMEQDHLISNENDRHFCCQSVGLWTKKGHTQVEIYCMGGGCGKTI